MKRRAIKNICGVVLSVNLLLLTGCGQYVIGTNDPEEAKTSVFKIIEDVSSKVSDVTSLISDYSPNIDIETTLAEEGKKPIPPETNQERFKDCYVYNTLSEEEQIAYSEIYDCIMDFKESAVLNTEDIQIATKAANAILSDHGGIFWIDGYGYTSWTDPDTNEILYIEFAPNYTMTKEEKDIYQTDIDTEVDNILASLSQDADDYEKIKYFYETLIKTVAYDKDSAHNQNIISVFLNKSTVCKGYTNAMQYLLSKVDIPCTIVTGLANGESHAWNLVKLDGDYYYVDTTWGNPSFLNEEKPEGYIDYKYLNVTTEDLNKTHESAESFELPECTATNDNYYVREGLYFTEFSEDTVGNIFKTALEENLVDISVRFSNSTAFSEMCAAFIDNQKIFDYCPNLRGVSYTEDNDNNIFTLFLA